MDEKEFGPVQLYVAPPPAVRLRVVVSHTGELLFAVGVGGGLTVTG